MGRWSKNSAEFRADSVQFVLESGLPRAEVARSLGLSDNPLANWVAAAREAVARAGHSNGLRKSEREELTRLRRENIDLRADREILRKAAACCARQTMR